jgi:hypothetical protein
VKAKLLSDSDDDYVYFPAQSPPGAMVQYQARNAWASYIPKAWRELQRLEPSPPLQMRAQLLGADRESINFLGERRTPSGKRRLVVIKGSGANALALQRDIEWRVVAPPTLFEKLPRPQPAALMYQGTGQYIPARLSAAVRDPDDPSRLTIEYVIERGYPPQRGLIDVFLRDDDTLDFKVRAPPARAGGDSERGNP